MTRDYGADVRDFLDLLDGAKPAHFVSEAITAVLRTEPPVVFGPEGVADLVADWAEERAERSKGTLSDLLLSGTRTIVGAYNIDAVASFRPRDFYPQYRERLVERCPEGERSVLEAALDTLQSKQPERWQLLPASELAKVATAPVRRSGGDSVEEEFEEALDRLRERPHLPEEEFQAAIAAVESLLRDPERVPSQPALVRAVDAATVLFNGAAVARAGRLFSLVAEALEHPSIAAMRRGDIRGGPRRRSLDDDLLTTWVNDARRRPDVAPVVRFFDDLAPEHLLPSLLSREAPLPAAHAQFLLNLLDAHGEGGIAAVLDHLAAAGAAYVPGLLGLVARHGTATDADRRRAIELAGPLLTSDDPAVRAAAVAALERLRGREVASHALRALEADAYRTELSADAAVSHLERVMGLLVSSDLDSAVAVVAEVATGARDDGFGRLGKRLRDTAVDALARRDGPLPRRAALVVDGALRSMARRRFVLITDSLTLGVDAEACLRLIRLVDDSPEPEVRKTLELPKLRKLATR